MQNNPERKIGYKATYNMVAYGGFKYEVGKTYEHHGHVEPCLSGFHYCRVMENVLNYYEPRPDFVLLEVEILSDIIVHRNDKSVTNKIKVLRVIPTEEHKLFTFENNTIHYKDNSLGGFEYWNEYDSKGNSIYFKNLSGIAWWKEYDSNNNIIHYRDHKNYQWWRQYDSNNNEIFFKTTDGIEEWYIHDCFDNYIKTVKSKEEYEQHYNNIKHEH